MNNRQPPRTVAFVRPAKRNSRSRQMARIEQHNPRIVVVEGEDGRDLATAIQFLRPGYGDTLAVSEMGVLGSRREELRAVLDAILVQRGARIIDGDGRSTDTVPEAVNMVLDAMRRKGLPSDKAAEIARLSRGREIRLDRKNDTLDDWLDPDMTIAELEARHGISYATLQRHWVADRLAAGLPPIRRRRRPGRPPKA